jgi:post-segregation antitoxin (ccd killing protein)
MKTIIKTIVFQKDLLIELQEKAKEKGLNVSALIRMYLVEKLKGDK